VTVVSVLRLPVRADSAATFERLVADLRILERSQESGGFLGGRLLRPLAAGEPFLVLAEWETPEAYQAWLDNPVREELGAQLEPLLLDEVVGGESYEEV